MYVALIKKNFVLHGKYCDVVQKLKLMCINVINCFTSARHYLLLCFIEIS